MIRPAPTGELTTLPRPNLLGGDTTPQTLPRSAPSSLPLHIISGYAIEQISIIRLRTEAIQIVQQLYTNYPDVAYDLLTYKMASTTVTIYSKANDVIATLCIDLVSIV